MRQLSINGRILVKALAQLTHKASEPEDWPWVIMFDGDLERAIAQVNLPSPRKSPVGLHTLEEDVEQHQVNGNGLPGLTIASPYLFVDLDEDYSWEGDLPQIAERDAWESGPVGEATKLIRKHLQGKVEIDGNTYKITYNY